MHFFALVSGRDGREIHLSLMSEYNILAEGHCYGHWFPLDITEDAEDSAC